MRIIKEGKTEAAVRVWTFSDGEILREPYTADAMRYLMLAVAMYDSPDTKAEAERRFREIALVLAEHTMRADQKALHEARKNEAIQKLMADPKFDALDTLEKDRAIAEAARVSMSKVRKFRPKKPRGRPRKSD